MTGFRENVVPFEVFSLALENACDVTDAAEDFPAVFEAIEAEVNEEIAVGKGLDFFACDRDGDEAVPELGEIVKSATLPGQVILRISH